MKMIGLSDLKFIVNFALSTFFSCSKKHKYLVSSVPLCCIGVYLYCRKKTRTKVSSDDAIVIIGCDSGLGYSLALHCKQKLGTAVIASVLDLDSEGAEHLKCEGIYIYQLDITQTNSIKDFVDNVRKTLVHDKLALRCVVNNAAVMILGEFEWQTDEQIRQQVEVNFLGIMRITKSLLPLIRAYFSRIIIISSHCHIQPIPGVAAYGGTKAALTSWADAIRGELRNHGVEVVNFIPGSFVTQSNILARQGEHFALMWNSMSEEAKMVYKDYFTIYAKYFSNIVQGPKLEQLKDPGIYETFESALLDEQPYEIYKIESWRYFAYHLLFKVLPTNARYSVIRKFMKTPIWTKNEVENSDKLKNKKNLIKLLIK